MKLHSITEIIEDIRLGKLVILMDDEGRENEGDLMVASECITPDIVNFMISQGKGLLCQTITEDWAKTLNLPLMAKRNEEKFSTNFTVSVEAATGVTTGISAHDRAQTIKVLADASSCSADIVSPGHIFPIVARQGGVLTRPGHTEAGCDLAQLAGLFPSCAIIEIINEDGSMARRADLDVFSRKFGIKLGTINDLIAYRRKQESVLKTTSVMASVAC